MPSRWIKVGYCDSDRIEACCPAARDLWIRLLVNADDFGRFDARPARVAASCFPLQTGCEQLVANCAQLLDELERADLIRRYEATGKTYLFITRFYERARSKPRFPDPPQELIEKEIAIPARSVCTCQSLAVKPQSSDSSRQPSTTTTTSTTTTHDHDQLPLPSEGGPPARDLRATGNRLPAKRQPPDSAETWKAFTQAYLERYGVEPLRDARANAQMASFIKRVGIEDAPHIARFYVEHSKAYYVQRQHSVAMLATDADALRTQWLSGERVTGIVARDKERAATTGDQVQRVLRAVREESKA